MMVDMVNSRLEYSNPMEDWRNNVFSTKNKQLPMEVVYPPPPKPLIGPDGEYTRPVGSKSSTYLSAKKPGETLKNKDILSIRDISPSLLPPGYDRAMVDSAFAAAQAYSTGANIGNFTGDEFIYNFTDGEINGPVSQDSASNSLGVKTAVKQSSETLNFGVSFSGTKGATITRVHGEAITLITGDLENVSVGTKSGDYEGVGGARRTMIVGLDATEQWGGKISKHVGYGEDAFLSNTKIKGSDGKHETNITVEGCLLSNQAVGGLRSLAVCVGGLNLAVNAAGSNISASIYPVNLAVMVAGVNISAAAAGFNNDNKASFFDMATKVAEFGMRTQNFSPKGRIHTVNKAGIVLTEAKADYNILSVRGINHALSQSSISCFEKEHISSTKGYLNIVRQKGSASAKKIGAAIASTKMKDLQEKVARAKVGLMTDIDKTSAQSELDKANEELATAIHGLEAYQIKTIADVKSNVKHSLSYGDSAAQMVDYFQQYVKVSKVAAQSVQLSTDFLQQTGKTMQHMASNTIKSGQIIMMPGGSKVELGIQGELLAKKNAADKELNDVEQRDGVADFKNKLDALLRDEPDYPGLISSQ